MAKHKWRDNMNKKLIVATLFALSAIFISGCTKSTTNSGQITDINSVENLKHLIIKIDGMYCPSCGPGIAKMLSENQGVVLAKVSRSAGQGEVIFDSTRTNTSHLLNMLHDPYRGEVITEMPVSQDMIEAVKALQND